MQVPSDWKSLLIQDKCKIIRGASPRPIGDPDYFGGDVGWVKISDVTASSKYLKKQNSIYHLWVKVRALEFAMVT